MSLKVFTTTSKALHLRKTVGSSNAQQIVKKPSLPSIRCIISIRNAAAVASGCMRAKTRLAAVDARAGLAAAQLAHLRPSLCGTLFDVSGSLVKPALVLVLTAGFFGSVSASPEEGSSRPLVVQRPAKREQLASRAVPNSLPPTAETMKNQVSFIAGLIAVHRPSLKNSGEIAKNIVEESILAGVDPLYIAAIISVESRFGAGERSSVGAMGLMQLMPATAKQVFSKQTGKKSYPQLTDPRTNIQLGIEYIKQLEAKYRGNRSLALAAYNWGPGNVDKVERNSARIPQSVNRYASKVLERFLRWQGHYRNAELHAEELAAPAIG